MIGLLAAEADSVAVSEFALVLWFGRLLASVELFHGEHLVEWGEGHLGFEWV